MEKIAFNQDPSAWRDSHGCKVEAIVPGEWLNGNYIPSPHAAVAWARREKVCYALALLKIGANKTGTDKDACISLTQEFALSALGKTVEKVDRYANSLALAGLVQAAFPNNVDIAESIVTFMERVNRSNGLLHRIFSFIKLQMDEGTESGIALQSSLVEVLAVVDFAAIMVRPVPTPFRYHLSLQSTLQAARVYEECVLERVLGNHPSLLRDAFENFQPVLNMLRTHDRVTAFDVEGVPWRINSSDGLRWVDVLVLMNDKEMAVITGYGAHTVSRQFRIGVCSVPDGRLVEEVADGDANAVLTTVVRMTENGGLPLVDYFKSYLDTKVIISTARLANAALPSSLQPPPKPDGNIGQSGGVHKLPLTGQFRGVVLTFVNVGTALTVVVHKYRFEKASCKVVAEAFGGCIAGLYQHPSIPTRLPPFSPPAVLLNNLALDGALTDDADWTVLARRPKCMSDVHNLRVIWQGWSALLRLLPDSADDDTWAEKGKVVPWAEVRGMGDEVLAKQALGKVNLALEQRWKALAVAAVPNPSPTREANARKARQGFVVGSEDDEEEKEALSSEAEG